ncbi:MAG: septum formation initiator family protein [Chloroflexi bacterium]|nr:septum formation initiator family protein [Chloroflexota bacterium]
MSRSTGRQSSVAAMFVALVALPLALYVLYATGQKALESYRMSQDADAMRGEIQDLQQQNLRLQREIEAARSDASVEQLAREQLGLVKPGDRALVIVAPTSTPIPPEPPAGSRPAAGRAEGPESPMWKQWWRFFFGPGRE